MTDSKRLAELLGFKKEVSFKKPKNFGKLLECLIRVLTNFTIVTDSQGKITISWFHFDTQLEEEYLNISDNLVDAIIKTAINIMDFPYVNDEFKQYAESTEWSWE